MGLIYNQLKQYDKAIECYEKAMEDKKHISLPNIWNEWTKAYNKIGQLDKSPACLQGEGMIKKTSYS
jgi:tetratricopeptide (TPR) repeat protein